MAIGFHIYNEIGVAVKKVHVNYDIVDQRASASWLTFSQLSVVFGITKPTVLEKNALLVAFSTEDDTRFRST